MKALMMTLNAPLRSWGGIAVGDTRPTDWAPSQSAVIGLLGAMVGLRRGDPAVANFYAGYDVWCVSGPKRPLSVGTKERGGQAYDFQTISQSIGGDGKELADSIISRRGYLVDWLDVVAVVPTPRAPVSLEILAQRSTTPAFHLYAGRKAFPLGDALEAELLETDAQALAMSLWRRWLDQGGEAPEGRAWIPAGNLTELPGFRAHRTRRTDVRQHYGFSERTVTVWRPINAPDEVKILAEKTTEESAAKKWGMKPSLEVTASDGHLDHDFFENGMGENDVQ
jgi:CRISPR system Cascade subunit CasD